MKNNRWIRDFYVLPCCVLLLNLCVSLVTYKAQVIVNPWARTSAIIGMVLFGGSMVGFIVEPAVRAIVGRLHRHSRKAAGGLGEMLFLLVLGGFIFLLYHRVYTYGPQSILPPELRNHR